MSRERFARWLDGGLDPDEEAALLTALSEDPALLTQCQAEARCAAWLVAVHGQHRAVATADSVMQLIASLSASTRLRRASAVMRRLPRRRTVWPWLAAAAGVFLAVGGWLLATRHSVAVGPQQMVLVGGGSIDLAAGARATRQDGVWRLESGLASVSVAPRATDSPAVVVLRTAESELAVHGTAFQVEASGGHTAVAVHEGVVAVRGAGGACLLPAGGRASATAERLRCDLGWQAGNRRPAWLAIGSWRTDTLVGESFADGFGTRGIDVRPLRLGVVPEATVVMRVRLTGGCPTLELWCRTQDGSAYVWKEFDPPQDIWLEREVSLSDFRADNDAKLPPPAGAVVDWLHLTIRDGTEREIVVERLVMRGFGPGGE